MSLKGRAPQEKKGKQDYGRFVGLSPMPAASLRRINLEPKHRGGQECVLRMANCPSLSLPSYLQVPRMENLKIRVGI